MYEDKRMPEDSDGGVIIPYNTGGWGCPVTNESVFRKKKYNEEVFLLEKLFVEIIVTKFYGNQSGYNAHSPSKKISLNTF